MTGRMEVLIAGNKFGDWMRMKIDERGERIIPSVEYFYIILFGLDGSECVAIQLCS